MRCLFVLLLAALSVLPASLAAQSGAQVPPEEVASPEIWLVTYGPGDIYWQRFGHNAIWVRDTGLGLDHVFNFGFFDFAQENFLLRFLQGRMLYFSAAQPAQLEFAQYIDDNRSIRAQRLGLTPAQSLQLTEYLVGEVQPDKRDYLYDYYLNNCSTRVRDAIDLALHGQLRDWSGTQAAAQNWRDHTRRLTQADFWLYLGLEVGLGSPVDAAISLWDEFFIPAELADGLTGLETAGSMLVQEDVMLFQSTAAEPPARAQTRWPYYLLIPASALLAAWLLARLFRRLTPLTLARTWLIFTALVGVALLFFWCCTDHAVARNNFNLMVFNPLWLLCLAGRRWWPGMAWLVIAVGVTAFVGQVWPAWQYNADVLAAFLPLNLAAAWILLRSASGGRDTGST